MRILIADIDTLKTGFTFTEPGELVCFGFECCNSGSCGCNRSFCGFTSRKGTTVAKVVEADISRPEYRSAYVDSMKAAGWFDFMTQDEMIQDADKLLSLANAFRADTKIRRNGEMITQA